MWGKENSREGRKGAIDVKQRRGRGGKRVVDVWRRRRRPDLHWGMGCPKNPNQAIIRAKKGIFLARPVMADITAAQLNSFPPLQSDGRSNVGR